MSKKTGEAPECIIAFTGDANVKTGTKTSSPCFIFKLFKANCRATVPFETAKQFGILV